MKNQRERDRKTLKMKYPGKHRKKLYLQFHVFHTKKKINKIYRKGLRNTSGDLGGYISKMTDYES